MRKSDWESFDDFEEAWWAAQPPHNPNCQSCLRCNGQFDELPYADWEGMPE